MKTILLLAGMLISAATFGGIKNDASKKATAKVRHPQGIITIDLNHLRSETKNVSMLKPVFAIVGVVQHTEEKLHGKTLKLSVTNALLTTTNVQ